MQRSNRDQPRLSLTFTADKLAYLDDFEERLHVLLERLATEGRHPRLIEIVKEVRSSHGESSS